MLCFITALVIWAMSIFPAIRISGIKTLWLDIQIHTKLLIYCHIIFKPTQMLELLFLFSLREGMFLLNQKYLRLDNLHPNYIPGICTHLCKITFFLVNVKRHTVASWICDKNPLSSGTMCQNTSWITAELHEVKSEWHSISLLAVTGVSPSD